MYRCCGYGELGKLMVWMGWGYRNGILDRICLIRLVIEVFIGAVKLHIFDRTANFKDNLFHNIT